jgi:ribonuclease P protein component
LVQAKGESAIGCFLILRFLKGPVEQPEAAYIVSRKIGQAVVRNRVKRRLRECFKSQKGSFLPPGYYLFIARTISAEATFKQLGDDMASIIERAGAMMAAMPVGNRNRRTARHRNGT